MTDLQDRLGRLAPTIEVEAGLGDLRGRVRRRRQRRRVVAGVVASVALVASVLGAVVVLDAGDESGRRVVTEPQPGRPVIEEGWVQLPDGPLPDGFFPLSPQAAWTGTEFLWWGHAEGTTLVGAAYDPESATWRRLADAPIRSRDGASVVWTGLELIVWGGLDVASGLPASGGRYDAAGAAYDPTTGSWRRIADAPIEPREGATAVWAGDRMIVAGGLRYDGPPECPDRETCLAQGQVGLPTPVVTPDGAAYDPVADRWEPIAESPGLLGETSAWDGEEVLTFGVAVLGADGIDAYGHAYAPDMDAWRPLSGRTTEGPALVDPRFAAAAGEVFAVEAAGDRSGAWYRYDRSRDRWVRTEQIRTPEGAMDSCTPTAVEAGAAVVVVGCGQSAYSTATGSWIPLDAYPGAAPGSSFDVVTVGAVGAGDRFVMVWNLGPYDPRQELPDPPPHRTRFVAYQGDFSEYTVPDVEGLTLGEARRVMADAGFVLSAHEPDPQGDDAIVRAQAPPAGTEVLGLTPEVGVRTTSPP